MLSQNLNECFNLSSSVQDFSPIIYYHSHLSFTTVPFFCKSMLSIWEKFIFIQMTLDVRANYVFEQLARYTSHWDRTIITCESLVTLFIEGTYICKRLIVGDFTRVKRLLEEMGKNWTQFSCKLIRPESFRRVQTFKKFRYTLIWNNNVIHERGRPTEKWDLTIMAIFVEHARKLTI